MPPKTIKIFFSGYGWFSGEVKANRNKSKYHIKHTDGHIESVSKHVLKNRIKDQNIKVGDVGYHFIRQWPEDKETGLIYSGFVKRILTEDEDAGKRHCYLTDKLWHKYTLEELEEWKDLQNTDKKKMHTHKPQTN